MLSLNKVGAREMNMLRRIVATKRPPPQLVGKDVDQSEKENRTNRFLVKGALLAAAIAAVAAMIGPDMHAIFILAIIILVGFGIAISILLSGGPPSDLPSQRGSNAFGVGPNSFSSGHHGGGQSSGECASAGGDCGSAGDGGSGC